MDVTWLAWILLFTVLSLTTWWLFRTSARSRKTDFRVIAFSTVLVLISGGFIFLARECKTGSSMLTLFLFLVILGANQAQAATNIIFLHPDGSALAQWEAARILFQGPDGFLNWDKMDRMALYRGHVKDSITASSNSGAVAHAYGTRPQKDSFGMDEKSKPILNPQGRSETLIQEGLRRGFSTGLINSGDITEPGTAVFVARARHRNDKLEIAKQVIESNVDLIFAGGEKYLLPQGTSGRFTSPDESLRRDGLHLIEWAKQNGYTVIYTKEELKKLSPKTKRVLGVFAKDHTFNDETEEVLNAKKKPFYQATAPSMAEMMDYALRFFRAKNKNFILIAEEEGSDNFGNQTNASGMLEALRRTDQAIGRVMEDVQKYKDSLLLVAADSNAGGAQVFALKNAAELENSPTARHARTCLLDGAKGSQTMGFVSAADRAGQKHAFAIAWASPHDLYGSVVAKAHGIKSEWLPSHVFNTDLYALMRAAAFGESPRFATSGSSIEH